MGLNLAIKIPRIMHFENVFDDIDIAVFAFNFSSVALPISIFECCITH